MGHANASEENAWALLLIQIAVRKPTSNASPTTSCGGRHSLKSCKHRTIKTETLHVSSERADRNPPVVEKWYVEKSDHGCRQRAVAYTNTSSSKVAAVQSGEISRQQPAQMPGLQPLASAVLARRQTPTTAARQQYRCDHCPPLPSPAVDSRHKPEPSALPCPLRRNRSSKMKTIAKSQTTNATFSAKTDS